MIDVRGFILPVVFLFIIAAVFGVYLMPLHADAGCTLQLGSVALCAAPLIEHVGDWSSAFAGTLSLIISFAALALFVIGRIVGHIAPARTRIPSRYQACVSERPLLFQELYSQGILNRRAP